MISTISELKVSNGHAQGSTVLTGDGVAVVSLCGLVTSAMIGRAMDDLVNGRCEARAFCMQADRAVLTLGADYMESVAREDVPAMSGALVVDVGMLELMRSYAWRMAHLGIVRKVFISRAKAMAWAIDQARLAAAQERWEKARCPLL